MSEALDHDIFEVSTARVKAEDLAHRHVRVRQNGAPDPSPNDIVSSPDALVAAIVDRDADIKAAAKALVLARFGLGGGSPYAPDIIFVNEWVKKEFLDAVTQACVGLVGDASGPGKGVGKAFLDEVSKEDFASVVSIGKGGVVLDIESR